MLRRRNGFFSTVRGSDGALALIVLSGMSIICGLPPLTGTSSQLAILEDYPAAQLSVHNLSLTHKIHIRGGSSWRYSVQ